MLTKIEIFEYFGPQSKFLENYNRYQDFNFSPKSRCSEKLTQNLAFPKIFRKISIFENFDQNRDFPIFFYQDGESFEKKKSRFFDYFFKKILILVNILHFGQNFMIFRKV